MANSKTFLGHLAPSIFLIALVALVVPNAIWAQGSAPVPGIPFSGDNNQTSEEYIAPAQETAPSRHTTSPVIQKTILTPAPKAQEPDLTNTSGEPLDSNAKPGDNQFQPASSQSNFAPANNQTGQIKIAPGNPKPNQETTSNPNTDEQNKLIQNLSHEMSKEEYKVKFDEWDQLQKIGAEAFRLCQYGDAERTLSVAVKKARQFGPGDVQFAQSSGELGRLLTVRGRFDEAEKLLQEELCLIEMAVDRDKSQMIDKMGAMVTFYLNHGTKDKAFPLTEDLLDFIEGKIREQRSQKSRTVKLNKDGTLVGWAGTAQPEDRDPLLEWSIILDKLGYLYRVEGELDMADRLFKAALDIKATVLGKKHLSLANSYDSLGTVCLTRKDYKDAESYFQDALNITQRILQPGDPQIFSRIDKLARCKIYEKKFSEASALYARAKDEFAYNKGIKQQALYRLGCLYSDARNFSAAAPALRQALNLAIKNHGSESIQLVPYLQKYAYVSYYLGNKGQNEQLKARANNINPVVKALKPAVQMKAGSWDKSTD